MLDLIEQTQGLAGKGAAVALAKEWLGIDDGWGGRVTSISPEERGACAAAGRDQGAAPGRRDRGAGQGDQAGAGPLSEP
jgi:hypothetical protein